MTETETEYSNLTPWTYPRDYGGQSWYGWFAVYGQHRDSEALDRSNYRSIFEDLKALNTELLAADIDPRNLDYDSEGDSTVCDTSCNHWAVGWVETIYVHSSNLAACKLADEILDALSDYCVYDESDFSEAEHDDEEQAWSNYYRSEFTRALERSFESWLEERMDDNAVDPEDAKHRVAAVMGIFEDLDMDKLFYEVSSECNVYWEHTSEGASIDAAKVAAEITNEELLELCGENESIFRAKRYCNYNPFQMYLDFIWI